MVTCDPLQVQLPKPIGQLTGRLEIGTQADRACNTQRVKESALYNLSCVCSQARCGPSPHQPAQSVG